ncbi:hypothetical protein CEXT_463511 [Caerostris extrusa]|uniref:Uncharacterized protein n=1 Tax=Caerostris extrusa TaxID=172846 RepID=A0AAV4PBA7_CAEEX|nr:hypothetical protein CEXT_463511 [Caerostris extrusa]
MGDKMRLEFHRCWKEPVFIRRPVWDATFRPWLAYFPGKNASSSSKESYEIIHKHYFYLVLVLAAEAQQHAYETYVKITHSLNSSCLT